MRTFFLLASIALLCGCNVGVDSNRDCNQNCSLMSARGNLRFAGGTATFSLGSTAVPDAAVTVGSGGAASMTCTLSNAPVEVLSIDPSEQHPTGSGLTLVCDAGKAGTISFELARPFDPRALSVGAHEISGWAVEFKPPCEGSECKRCIEPRIPSPSTAVRVVVEEANGGPAPQPQFVTADYSRKLRIELEIPSGEITNVGESCTTFSMHASITLEQKASDWSSKREICYCA